MDELKKSHRQLQRHSEKPGNLDLLMQRYEKLEKVVSKLKKKLTEHIYDTRKIVSELIDHVKLISLDVEQLQKRTETSRETHLRYVGKKNRKVSQNLYPSIDNGIKERIRSNLTTSSNLGSDDSEEDGLSNSGIQSLQPGISDGPPTNIFTPDTSYGQTHIKTYPSTRLRESEPWVVSESVNRQTRLQEDCDSCNSNDDFHVSAINENDLQGTLTRSRDVIKTQHEDKKEMQLDDLQQNSQLDHESKEKVQRMNNLSVMESGDKITVRQNYEGMRQDFNIRVPNDEDAAINSKNDIYKEKPTLTSQEVYKDQRDFQRIDQAKVCKNDFGFKQKRSEEWSDNRIAYHSKQLCFEGVEVINYDPPPSESPAPPNIPTVDRTKSQKHKHMRKGHYKDYLEEHTMGLVSDSFGKPRTKQEWLAYADQLRVNAMTRVQSGAVWRGRHGHDSILVLDCSSRMIEGKKFEIMIKAATQYVEGIMEVRNTRLLEDNIGLAVFGGQSTLLLESTCDYDLVLRQIRKLKPGGEAPLLGGLLMGLAGVLGGATSQILENEAQGHMIVFTDGSSANDSVKDDMDHGHPSYFTGNLPKLPGVDGVIKQIAGHAIRIYYVPIGEYTFNHVMESAVMETRGKIIHINEMYRLIRMTQVLILAAQVASDLRYTNPNPTREIVTYKIMERTSNQDDLHEDNVDMVMDFLNPFGTDKQRGMYCELNCKSLYLGARVRRGPNWMFDDQDSGMAGTVIGQDNMNNIWVEWDSGNRNIYMYDEGNRMFSIMEVHEPRFLYENEIVAVGCRVIRGSDWVYGDEDGGLGGIGTVLNVRHDDTVLVRWDNRQTGLYKMGNNGMFEVNLCEDPFASLKFTTEVIINHPSSPDVQTNNNTNIDIDKWDTNKIDMKTPVNAIWEYEDGDNDWKQYEEESNFKIEKAFEKKQPKTMFKTKGTTYTINFQEMIQKTHIQGKEDKSINKIRRIKRQ